MKSAQSNRIPITRRDHSAVGGCNRVTAPVPSLGRWAELLNSDAAVYGGSGMGNGGGVEAEDTASHGLPASLSLVLPPLSTLVLRAG